MKESIYTIPISEVFEPKEGCPLCALHNALEERWVGYITGAAMMEPDVRLRTNQEGFCGPHLEAMLRQRNRLSVALLLQTRLQTALEELDTAAPGKTTLFGKRRPEAPPPCSCFVCNRVESELQRLAGNVAAVWARDTGFQVLYADQEYLCLPHHRLLTAAASSLSGSVRGEFLEATSALARKGIAGAKEDIDAFCKLFDHRSSGQGQPPPQVSSAVETAALRLRGREFDGTKT